MTDLARPRTRPRTRRLTTGIVLLAGGIGLVATAMFALVLVGPDRGEAVIGGQTCGLEPAEGAEPAEPAEPAEGVGRPAGTGAFRTEGARVIDPDGDIFVPIGGNVTAEPYPPAPIDSWWTTDQRYATGKSDDALAWGWNFVRISVSTDGQPEVTLRQHFDGVFRLIDEYTAKGIVVTASLWDFMGENPTWAEVEANPHVLALHDEMVARYATNPYVWLNPLNEPFEFDHEAGGGWAEVGTRFYERARSQGWEGIFVWELPSYGQRIDLAAETPVVSDFLRDKDDVVIGWHNYGIGDDEAQDRWAAQVIERRIPVVITEFGQHWDPEDHSNEHDEGERRGAAWTLDRFDDYGFGAVVWHASGPSYNQYALRMGTGSAFWDDEAALPLSEVGARMLELGRAPASPGPCTDLGSASSGGGDAPMEKGRSLLSFEVRNSLHLDMPTWQDPPVGRVDNPLAGRCAAVRDAFRGPRRCGGTVGLQRHHDERHRVVVRRPSRRHHHDHRHRNDLHLVRRHRVGGGAREIRARS